MKRVIYLVLLVGLVLMCNSCTNDDSIEEKEKQLKLQLIDPIDDGTNQGDDEEDGVE